MSIKLYDGLKIKADSLDEAVALIEKKKPIIKQIIKEQELQSYFYKGVHTLVEYLLYKEDILKKYFDIDLEKEECTYSEKSNILSILDNEYHNADKSEQEESCTLIIFPQKTLIDNQSHYLALMYTPMMAGKKIQKEMSDIITEYGYWDNVEPPEDVTDEQWDERLQHWEKAFLSKSAIASVDGISITLSPTNLMNYIFRTEKMKSITEMCDKLENFDFAYYDKSVSMLSHILISKNSQLDDHTKTRVRIKNNQLSPEELILKENFYDILYRVLPEKITPELFTKSLQEIKESLDSRKMSLELNSNLNTKNKKSGQKI